MGKSYEVVVAGLGVMGAAITLELARRGVRVLGIDRYSPPHSLGSSHGATRIIREAYFEHPQYVPLVRLAFDGWAALEREAGISLYQRTGALVIGNRDSSLIRGSLESVRIHDVPHEFLGAGEIRARFPQFDPPDGQVGVLEQRAGTLLAEPAVQAMLDLARSLGAEIRFDEPLLGWTRSGAGLEFRTPAETLPCGRLVLATGPWLPALLDAGGLARPARIEVERQVIAFHEPADGRPAAVPPTVLWEYEPDSMFYIMPDGSGGTKAAIHHGGTPFDPEPRDRPVGETDTAAINGLFDRLAPGRRGPMRSASMCLYTNMPDGHFLLDTHPGEPNVIVASACSGHGFKFAPALAPLVADMTLGHPSGAELLPFGWRGRRTPA